MVGELTSKATVPVVTIDGPSSSGKGTISRIVARRAGWHLLDSGALYRLVALAGQLAGADPDDVESHVGYAQRMRVRFGINAAGEELVELNGQEVTQELRSEQTGQGASRVAVWPAVRAALVDRQRAFVEAPGLIADGRDMGTVIFPQAPLKVFLTASAEERAQRRHKQLIGKGSAANLRDLSREIAERDERDSNRAVAPLKPAADAVLVDSTGVSIDTVVERVMALGRERGLWR